MVGSRILLIPVIAAIGYEILKFGARHRANPIVKVLLYPGLLVQMITTKQPTDDMIEVAIVSMEQALEADGETVPEGSGDFARRPLGPPMPASETNAAASTTTAGAASAAPNAANVASPATVPTDSPPGS